MMGNDAVGVALCYIGNRASGQKGFGENAGIPLMTIGLFIQHAYPLWALAIIAPLVLNFRLWTTHPWFAVFQQHKWAAAFIRGLAVLPLSCALAYLQWHMRLQLWWTPVAVGIVSVFTLAVWYWLGSRMAIWWGIDEVEAAELMVGGNIGLIGL